MGSSLAKECSVVHLTTAKHDALVVVPVNCFSIPNRNAPLFELLHSARCDPYVRHWFGAPSGLESQVERGTSLTPPLSPEEFYGTIVSNFGETTSQWMILRLMDDFTSSLSSAYVPLSLLVNHVKANLARTSAAGYFCLGQSSMLRQGFQSVDFFMTRALCNDAKSGVLFQLVALQCQRYVEHQPKAAVARLPLVLYVRQGNLPVIRMLQKLYTQHISPMAMGTDELVQVSQVQPGWLRVFVEDGQLVEALRWRLSATIQMAVGPDATSRLVLFTDRQRAELPTPFDLAVERAVPIWDVERRPVVSEAKLLVNQAVVVGSPATEVAPRPTMAGPLPIGSQPPDSSARPLAAPAHPRYRNPNDSAGAGGRVPNQHPLRDNLPIAAPIVVPVSLDAVRVGKVGPRPANSSPTPGGGVGASSPSTNSTTAEFWDNTPAVEGMGTVTSSSGHLRYSSVGTATSFTSDHTGGDDDGDSSSSGEPEGSTVTLPAVTTASAPPTGKPLAGFDPARIPPFTPAQVWREGGWASYWFAPDTYSHGNRSTSRLVLTEQQPYKGAILMRASGEFRFLDATGSSVNIRSSGQKSAFFLSVPADAFPNSGGASSE